MKIKPNTAPFWNKTKSGWSVHSYRLKHFLMIWRIDQSINRPGSEGVAFRDIFCKNFYITTSGFFSDPAMLCCLQEMGVEHVLFSVDWPFVENKPGTDWMESISLSTSDKELILNGNAKRILHI